MSHCGTILALPHSALPPGRVPGCKSGRFMKQLKNRNFENEPKRILNPFVISFVGPFVWPSGVATTLALLLCSSTSALSQAATPFQLNPNAQPVVQKSKLTLKLRNWGLSNQVSESHIHAEEAWSIEQGSKKVVVAVIDTGIDPNHKDLSQNLWQDPKETRRKVAGWNFVTDRPIQDDDHGHGTHVAGIIGAAENIETGVAGVAPKISLMPVKYYSESNSGATNLRNTIRALNYAIDHGAQIINYSGGGPEFSQDEYMALRRAEAKGILVVAAAGNEHQNTDLVENYYFPSAYRLYKLDNIISVAATDMNNALLSSSNWGKKSVDVCAPGENIYSTLPQGRYGLMTGTSQATAFVSGVAALLLSKNSNLKPAQIKALIMQSVDPFPHLASKLASGGRINAFQALRLLLELQRKTSPKNLEGGNPILAHQFDPDSIFQLNALISPPAKTF